jgi:hypothetical protein
MPKTITYHEPLECGCTATSWYASSECGMFDDSDTVVDPCEWHALLEDAFSAWLLARDSNETYSEPYWVQVVEREREYDTSAHDYTWLTHSTFVDSPF